MIRFIVGLAFGVAFCGTVLWALAILNPLERSGQAAPPAQVEQGEDAGAQAQPEPEPAPEPEPGPEVAPERITVPSTGGLDDQQGAAPQPSDDARPSQQTASAPEPAPAAAPEAVPLVGALDAPGGDAEVAALTENDAQAPEPAPEIAPADAMAADAAQVDTAPGAPQAADDAAPMMAMSEGESAGPSVGGSGPAVLGSGPDVGGGIELSAPAFGGDEGANIGASGNDRPIRTAAAPQQVTAGSTDTGARPAVNTESTGTPEIGGSELEAEDLSPGPAPALESGTALADNAAVFSGDRARPLMSIILIDTGEFPDLRAGLTALTAPITFGIDAAIPDAESVARTYRNAGFEVSAVLPGSGPMGLVEDLPEERVEPLLARTFARVPVAATVMDPIGGPLPRDRGIANAMLDALAVTGHGLLTHRGNGLNNVPIIAGEKGVPSELVYRVIDAESGSANISLALERAVLDASRSGHVIVVGRVRQETVTTLFSWLLGSGAREVTIAPASAVLRENGQS